MNGPPIFGADHRLLNELPTALAIPLLDVRPSVAQGHRAVEYGFAVGGIRVNAEVAFPLELELIAGFGFGKARLHLRFWNHLQGVGIEVVAPILVFFQGVQVLNGEQPIVEADFRV